MESRLISLGYAPPRSVVGPQGDAEVLGSASRTLLGSLWLLQLRGGARPRAFRRGNTCGPRRPDARGGSRCSEAATLGARAPLPVGPPSPASAPSAESAAPSKTRRHPGLAPGRPVVSALRESGPGWLPRRRLRLPCRPSSSLRAPPPPIGRLLLLPGSGPLPPFSARLSSAPV